jgi:hypothetical protein
MLFCSEIFMCYKSYRARLLGKIYPLKASKSNVVILIENLNVFMKEEFLGIFGYLFKGGEEINFAHTARQGKSGDGERKRDHL